jgi:hypothetical protein
MLLSRRRGRKALAWQLQGVSNSAAGALLCDKDTLPDRQGGKKIPM